LGQFSVDERLLILGGFVAQHDPFGGVPVEQQLLHHFGMDKTREFWLRFAVIAIALLLSSAMLAFG
jgi:hypothetical protein